MDVFMPTTLKEALENISKDGNDVEILGHGTDLIPRIRNNEIMPKKLLDLSALDTELNYINEDGGVLRIGALTTIRQIYDDKRFEGKFGAFIEMAKIFGGPQIRNMATVGGNLGAASSSEDLIPIFISLDAKVKMASLDGDRIVSVNKLILGKRRIDRRPNEIIKEVYFDSQKERIWTTFVKVGRRNSLIINLVNVALYLKLDMNHKVEVIRIAMSRVKGKTPERAFKTEEFLKGKQINEDTVKKAEEVLEKELQLSSDFRASSEYRKSLDKVILGRSLYKCRDNILRDDK